MKQRITSGFTTGQMAVLRIFLTATQQVAGLMAAGSLITCASFHHIILCIHPLIGLRVISFSLIEIPDEFPAVIPFVHFHSDLYRCTFFLFPVEKEGYVTYIPMWISVSIERHPGTYPFADLISGVSA